MLTAAAPSGGETPAVTLNVVPDRVVHESHEVAVVGGIGQRLVAVDEEGRGADGDVVEKGVGDLLVAADQRRGVARGTGCLGQGRPETLVVQVALGGELQESLGPLGLGGVDGAPRTPQPAPG